MCIETMDGKCPGPSVIPNGAFEAVYEWVAELGSLYVAKYGLPMQVVAGELNGNSPYLPKGTRVIRCFYPAGESGTVRIYPCCWGYSFNHYATPASIFSEIGAISRAFSERGRHENRNAEVEFRNAELRAKQQAAYLAGVIPNRAVCPCGSLFHDDQNMSDYYGPGCGINCESCYVELDVLSKSKGLICRCWDDHHYNRYCECNETSTPLRTVIKLDTRLVDENDVLDIVLENYWRVSLSVDRYAQ